MKTEDKVQKIFDTKPDTLTNEMELCCQVWNQFYGVCLTREQIIRIKRCPAETITRISRVLRKLPENQPDIKVRQLREQRAREMADKYGGQNPLLAVKEKRKTAEPSLPYADK